MSLLSSLGHVNHSREIFIGTNVLKTVPFSGIDFFGGAFLSFFFARETK